MFNRLRQEGNKFFIERKRKFVSNSELSLEDLEFCFTHAYDMTLGRIGVHRDHRTGGHKKRTLGERFANAFQGKIAEYAFRNYCLGGDFNISEPDIRVMGENRWDRCDFILNENLISIKSTKAYGNLLLLETGDYNQQGAYIHVDEDEEPIQYDYFVFMRVNPFIDDIMNNNEWLARDEVPRDQLKNVIFSNSWEFNIGGYISSEEFVSIIREGFILPQGAMLNGRVPMDAENYYIQAGDMHNIDELLNIVTNN